MSRTQENPGHFSSLYFLKPYVSHANTNFTAGLISGVATTGVFNPWDRALYLAVKNNSSFLQELLKGNPYQGFSQTIVQRSFSGMLYFALAGQLREFIIPLHVLPNGVDNFVIGTLAGVGNGMILNGLSVVKYHTWGADNRKFITSLRTIVQKGGVSIIFKGMNATIARDCVFGCIYEVTRHWLQSWTPNQKSMLLSNMVSAACATVVSGPFNYARNIKYGTSSALKPPPTLQIIKSLIVEASQTDAPLRFLQRRLQIGWGTARVAVGMAFAQMVFDNAKAMLIEIQRSK